HMSALKGKADMTVSGNPLSRSLSGVKRTSLFAAHMSFVILPVGLIHLVTDLIYFAIGLDLGFIAPDNFQYLLCVTLGHLGGIPSLSLGARRYGGDQQNGNKYLRANGRVVRLRENQAARRQSNQGRSTPVARGAA